MKSYPSTCLILLLAGVVTVGSLSAQPNVRITEIMYNPVEEPAFDPDGTPVFDLSENIHEYVELFNAGGTAVTLTGWRFSGGITFDFPAGSVIEPGRYLVVAKDRLRLGAVEQYGLLEADLLGPYDGQLSNRGETIRLRDQNSTIVDEVTYSAAFPWSISADSLGAGDRWTGLNAMDYQYRGRSLERVSFTWDAKDPANWLASPLPGEPSPGRANAVSRSVPQPVVLRFGVTQEADGQLLIQSNQPVRVECTFSATNDLSEVAVEYFHDLLNEVEEPTTILPMTDEGAGSYSAILPGQDPRSIIRYRFRANRGSGDEAVSPRDDDPFDWHAYFVTLQRAATTNEIYELFISSSNLNQLNTHFAANPRQGYIPPEGEIPNGPWNDEVPGVFIQNGVVRDVVTRYNGSYWRRSVGRQSYKVVLPRYSRLRDRSNLLLTDKNNRTWFGFAVFREVGMPSSETRWVDLYVNNNTVRRRMEFEDVDGDLMEKYHKQRSDLSPGEPEEIPGYVYKSSGIGQDAGPYGRGNGAPLPDFDRWPSLERYAWTYSLKNDKWHGFLPLKTLIDDMASARGFGSPGVLLPLSDSNLASLRAFGEENFDLDSVMTFLATRNWLGVGDDSVHNFFIWRMNSGKYSLLPWDFDADSNNENSTSGAERTIWLRANFFKDNLLHAFRDEFRQRLFVLNNTALHPDNIASIGLPTYRTWATARQRMVNQQLGLGEFRQPARPVNVAPAPADLVFAPASLRSSPYSYPPTPPAAHVSTTWRIRSAEGTYLNPVFQITTPGPVTSFPLPFDQLEFGQVYYWQCFHTDANGHPSPPSDETAFAYGSSSGEPMDLLAINATTQWRYERSGDQPPADWNQSDFDDSSWPEGAAVFGVDSASLAEPIRTPLITQGRTTFYFRTHFEFQHDPAGAILHLNTFLDDGAIFYLNGQEVWRIRMPGGPADASTLASVAVDNAVREGPFTIPESSLRRGDNVLAVEVHQAATSDSDSIFGLGLSVSLPPNRGSVVLNEIVADNSNGIRNGEGRPDWVEFFNTSDDPVDLDGLSLTDDPKEPLKFVFPPNSVVPPRGFLIVWCDRDSAAPGLHAGFSLNADGESLSLIEPTAEGFVIRDTIRFGLQAPDLSIARSPDGFGPWRLSNPTPEAPNEQQALGSQNDLVINEWMANPQSGDDWLELHNAGNLPVAIGGLYLTCDLDSVTNSRLPDLSFIGPGGFTQLFGAADDPSITGRLNFNLRSSGESLWLFRDAAGFLLDSVRFDVQTRGISQGRLPDGSPTFAFFPGSASPRAANRQYQPLTSVQINEVLAHADAAPPIAPELEGAIELQNTTAEPINVGRWWLSDDADEPRKFSLPDPTVIAPGEFHVVYENQFNAAPGEPSSFALDAGRGGEVILSEADGAGSLTGARVSVSYGPTASDVSFGHVETSIGTDFTALQEFSFGVAAPATVEEFRTGTGAPNGPARVGPVVISEVHYNPEPGEPVFIELENISGNAVPLFDPARPANTWRLNGVGYTFPGAIVLNPGQRLLVVEIDPADFRTRYGLGQDILVVGPFDGRLQPTGERLELEQPGLQDPTDATQLSYITVDRVDYNDNAPWPTAAGGSGASLQRQPLAAYGNDPVNWTAATPTPGQSLLPGGPPQITQDPLPFDVQEGLDVVLFATATGTGPLRYQWQFNGANLPGANSNLLSLASVTAAEMGIYTLVVFDDRGFAVSQPAAGVVRPAPKILADPKTQRLPPGGTAYLQVAARGTGGVRYQWFRYGAPIVEATNSTLTITNLQLTSAGDYYATVTDAVGTVVSATATLVAVIRPSFSENPQSQTVPVGTDVTLYANVSPNHPSLPAAYRWRRNGRTIVRDGESWGIGSLTLTNVQLTESGARYTVVATNAGNASPGILSRTATLTVIEFEDADQDGLPDDWERANDLNPDDPDDADVDTDGDGLTNREEHAAGTDPQDRDSFLSIEQATAEAGGVNIEFNALSNIVYTVEWRESLQLGRWTKLQDFTQTTQVVTQVVLTDSQPAAEGRFYRLTTPRQLNPVPGPVIYRSPLPLVVNAGEDAFFDIVVTGTGAMGYQWLVDDQFIAGATEPSLTITNVHVGDAGAYTVQITDLEGLTTNAVPATLTVRP